MCGRVKYDLYMRRSCPYTHAPAKRRDIQSILVPRKHGYVSQAPYVDKLMKNGLLYNGCSESWRLMVPHYPNRTRRDGWFITQASGGVTSEEIKKLTALIVNM